MFFRLALNLLGISREGVLAIEVSPCSGSYLAIAILPHALLAGEAPGDWVW